MTSSIVLVLELLVVKLLVLEWMLSELIVGAHPERSNFVNSNNNRELRGALKEEGLSREGYRFTKVNFVHVYPQISLLWSNKDFWSKTLYIYLYIFLKTPSTGQISF